MISWRLTAFRVRPIGPRRNPASDSRVGGLWRGGCGSTQTDERRDRADGDERPCCCLGGRDCVWDLDADCAALDDLFEPEVLRDVPASIHEKERQQGAHARLKPGPAKPPELAREDQRSPDENGSIESMVVAVVDGGKRLRVPGLCDLHVREVDRTEQRDAVE